MHDEQRGKSKLKILIEKGADINTQTHKGLSALHLACQGGSKESVKVLLTAGIDVELNGVSDSLLVDNGE